MGVQSVLRGWGVDEHISDAGLFHSIYGTEGFQGYSLPLDSRPRVRQLIGHRAERLAWLFCMIDRHHFDQTVADSLEQLGTHSKDLYEPKRLSLHSRSTWPSDYSVTLKARPELGAFSIPIKSIPEWLDFLELSLADWMEQVRRLKLTL